MRGGYLLLGATIGLVAGLTGSAWADGQLGRLGISFQNVTPEIASSLGYAKTGGVIIAAIRAGSSAEKAGLHVGDIILTFDGVQIQNGQQLWGLSAQEVAGKSVLLTAIQDRSEKQLRLTIPVDLSYSASDGVESSDYIEPFAGNVHSRGPLIKAFYGQGFASNQILQQTVGTLSIQVAHCDESKSTLDSRIVRVDLQSANYDTGNIIDGILLRAAEFAWHNCPRTYVPALRNNVDYLYDIHEIDVYLPDGTLAVRASLGTFGYSDGALWSNTEYHWNVSDIVGEQRKAEAQREAQAQAAAQQVHQEQVLQRQLRAQAQQRQEEWDREAPLRFLDRLIVFTLIALIVAFFNRKRIARLYYSLTPHPAAGIVRAAVNSGVELDGPNFSAILRPIPGNPIEMEVRQRQAQALRDLAKRSKEELERKTAELKEKLRKQAAYRAAHSDLHDTTIEQQVAKMRADVLARVSEFANRGAGND